MSWTQIATCNKCHATAPNPNRTPAQWVTYTTPGGSAYHYCFTCIVELMTTALSINVDFGGEMQMGNAATMLSRRNTGQAESNLT